MGPETEKFGFINLRFELSQVKIEGKVTKVRIDIYNISQLTGQMIMVCCHWYTCEGAIFSAFRIFCDADTNPSLIRIYGIERGIIKHLVLDYLKYLHVFIVFAYSVSRPRAAELAAGRKNNSA